MLILKIGSRFNRLFLAIRETESLWVFGVKDHDIAQMDYIDYDHVPDVDSSWLNVQDLTKCRKSFRWSGEVR